LQLIAVNCGIWQIILQLLAGIGYFIYLTLCYFIPKQFMLKKEHQAFILHNVNLRNHMLIGDLRKSIHVSEEAIRKNSQLIAEHGKLLKVPGGTLCELLHENKYYACIKICETR
jgi:hypothetical protein